MAAFIKRKGSIFASDRIVYIRPGEIEPNPRQPRKVFAPEDLETLAKSIEDVGILQPLTVRKRLGGYELVSGERRLRAAKLAGLSLVPCIVAGITDKDSALLALVENLQRRDLDFFEEAAGIAKMLSEFKMTQQEAAEKLGRSQSAIANKLRLLKLEQPVMDKVRQAGLSERHARTLLRLEPEQRERALNHIIKTNLNVAQTESYIDHIIKQAAAVHPTTKPKFIIKDVRMFVNTIDRAVALIRKAGVTPDVEREEDDGHILVKIRIPKTQERAAQ